MSALFCRVCGRELTGMTHHSEVRGFRWTVDAVAPVEEDYFSIPQLTVFGDMLVSSQGLDFVFTSMSKGKTLQRVRFPGTPKFSATPLRVRERLFSIAPGFLWEYNLVEDAQRQANLKGFVPSALCMPVHTGVKGVDYVVAPGTTGGDGTAELLVYDVQEAREVRRIPQTLEPEDSFFTPVRVSEAKTILTTLHGRLFELRTRGESPRSWRLDEKRLKKIPFKRFFSAPSCSASTGSVFVEFVKKQTLERGVLVLQDDRAFLFPLGSPPETFNSHQWPLLIFPPLTCGSFAVIRSEVGAQCHFVSEAGLQSVVIEGLQLDPIASASGMGRVVSAGGGSIQSFSCVPAAQKAQTITVKDLGDSMVLNRPVLALNTVFVQVQHRLIAREVEA